MGTQHVAANESENGTLSPVESRAEHGSSARGLQTSIFSAISSASSISTPRYSDHAFDLGVAEEELDGPQVTGPAVDQCRLGPTHGVRCVLERVEADVADRPRHSRAMPSMNRILLSTSSFSEPERWPTGAPRYRPASGEPLACDRPSLVLQFLVQETASSPPWPRALRRVLH